MTDQFPMPGGRGVVNGNEYCQCGRFIIDGACPKCDEPDIPAGSSYIQDPYKSKTTKRKHRMVSAASRTLSLVVDRVLYVAHDPAKGLLCGWWDLEPPAPVWNGIGHRFPKVPPPDVWLRGAGTLEGKLELLRAAGQLGKGRFVTREVRVEWAERGMQLVASAQRAPRAKRPDPEADGLFAPEQVRQTTFFPRERRTSKKDRPGA